MRRAIAVTLAIACVAGLVLTVLVGWELLAVGAAAVVATLGYSGGSRPYASMGLGEVFVFVFFGLVATAGTTYVMDERITVASLLAGVTMGALATALLLVNNLRDIPTDRATGKRTLAVRIGEGATRRLWFALVVLAVAALLVLMVALEAPVLLIALFPLLELVRRARTTVLHAPLGPKLVPVLEAIAQAQLLSGLLLAGAIVAHRVSGGLLS